MIIFSEEIPTLQLKFFVRDRDNDKEIGRAFLVIAHNSLHEEPFGLLEDVFVAEESRDQGLGDALVRHVIKEAKRRGCYKLIATSRHERGHVHAWYRRLGFSEYGTEFRMKLQKVKL